MMYFSGGQFLCRGEYWYIICYIVSTHCGLHSFHIIFLWYAFSYHASVGNFGVLGDLTLVNK